METDAEAKVCPECESENIQQLARMGPEDEYACYDCWSVFAHSSREVVGQVSPEWRAGYWPKEWDEITENEREADDPLSIAVGTSWVDMGPIRIYDDTIYINPDGVWEGENRDVWMPLGQYMAGWPVGFDE